MIELGRLDVWWRGFRWLRYPFGNKTMAGAVDVHRFGDGGGSVYWRVLIGPLHIRWWTVMP